MPNRSRPRPVPRLAAAIAAAAGFAAIATALIAQYGFGLHPCELCLAQRVPFVLAGLLGLAALCPRGPGSRRRTLVALAGLAFLVNSGIAVYHVGVEHHWWASPGCSGSIAEAPHTVADLAQLAAQPSVVPCDQPVWEWHGITMAGFNIPYSGGLALVILLLLRRREERP